MSKYTCRECGPYKTKTHYSYYECDECCEPIGPVHSTPDDKLLDLVEEMNRYSDRDVDKFASKLKDLIDNE